LKIDSHHHLWKYRALDFPWIERSLPPLRRDFSADEFEATSRRAGYNGSIAIQARQSLDETRFLLETTRNRPFIRAVVGWVDLRSADLESQLDEFEGSRLVGGRHVVHDEPDDFLQRPEVLRGLRVVERRGLTFDLLLFPRHLRPVASVVTKFPRMTFILDHLGKPLEDPSMTLADWRRDIGELSRCSNVAVKASGFVTESSPGHWDQVTIQSVLDTAFELFGPSRVLASSNWPFSELAGTYSWAMGWLERYVELFPAPISKQVLGENAIRVYGLDPS